MQSHKIHKFKEGTIRLLLNVGTNISRLPVDVTLNDASKSTEAVEQIRSHLLQSGLSQGDFKIIDEYKNPSKNATGGHIHVNFKDKETAELYSSKMDKDISPKSEKLSMTPLSPMAPLENGWIPH